MPQNTTITLTASTWTQLSDADIDAITFQNRGGTHMFVSGTTDTSAPTDFDGAIRYNPGQGERNVALVDLFPGLTGVDRLWAFSDAAIDVTVSHA
jgi:hypothetical protein